VSRIVALRRREIAIRLALGAASQAVVRLVLGRALMLVFVGLGIGIAAALWTARFVESLLYGLESRAPATLAAAAALAAVGFLAAWWPARRAARTNPTETLHSQ
jgi:ABC-type antimicrobial peptide transport system permease subunit